MGTGTSVGQGAFLLIICPVVCYMLTSAMSDQGRVEKIGIVSVSPGGDVKKVIKAKNSFARHEAGWMIGLALF